MSKGNSGNGKRFENGEGYVLVFLKEVHPQLDKSSPDAGSLPHSTSTEHCCWEYDGGLEGSSELQQ